MKFLKTLLASFLGCAIALFIAVLVCIGFIGSLALLGQSSAPVVPENGILKMDFKNVVSERAVPVSAIALLQGQNTGTTTIYDAIKAVERAAADPGVRFIYMEPDNFAGSISSLEELRNALEKFRASGKAIISFTQTPTLGSYWLASVSDKIYMAPYGSGMILGLGSQMIYFKDLLDEIGINIQLIRHGKYKSAGEPYIKSEMSPENRKQNEDMLNAIWDSIGEEIAQARGITVEELDSMINGLRLDSPADFMKYGLIDGTATKDEMTEKLCTLYEVEDEKDLSFIPFDDYAISLVPKTVSKNKIAVVYADGEIVEGKSTENIGGDSFSKQLSEIRKDTTIRTIVFRVNSPGGSVSAAEKIKREIDLIKGQGRTVIASYGSYAASGGYWISANCDYIFSDATTLTGSIGVFSMIPDIGKVIKEKAHLNVYTIKTHEHADMFNMMRPLDAEEERYMQASVDTIYTKFTKLVAQGRGMEVGYVDEIAQGRVWAGTEALEIGLVDEIGGLADAIEYAAAVSGYSDYEVVQYPKPKTQIEMLMEQFGGMDAMLESPFENAYRNLEEVSGKMYARLPWDYEFEF
ncbi:MAG: signal peptide peptidase SppA [Bacteroidetes bacterium]|uniref:Signal peptide peptidase SppA n=1 Tax=Candidatus Merdivivens pullistercoris TaxID=2840873 RepID=A0A9D9NA20_9BACT|nr:signal peptide peptidase SppA [Candidatus Merdivivens pullistercoris]